MFDFVPFATVRFKILRHKKSTALPNFLQNIEHCVAYLAKKFASFFSDVTKFQNAWLPMARSQTDKYGSSDKENGGTRFGDPLYYLK